MLSTGHGRKTDEADAPSVGIAALSAARLNTAVVEEAITALRTLSEHRDDLVRTRTQTVNRLHALLAQLVPAGLPRRLTAEAAATALRSIRPRAVLARTLRQVAVDLLGEVRRLDRRITEATATLSAVVAASGTNFDRTARHRRRPGREDPRQNRCREPVPVSVSVRLVLRRRTDRSVLR
jgi:transposase